MNIKVIFSIMLLGWCFFSEAQTTPVLPQVPQVIPSSPQSRIFEKYLNHSISEYNGLPDISIPLYEIEVKGLIIPITLSYHASGIKYGQYDGDVGAGWSINAGGFRVSRTIYDWADEDNTASIYRPADYTTYLNYQPGTISQDLANRVSDAYFASMSLSNDGNFIRALSGYNFPFYDAGYDHFMYMLPSASGDFIVTDRTNKVTASTQALDKIIIDEGVTGLKLENIKIMAL